MYWVELTLRESHTLHDYLLTASLYRMGTRFSSGYFHLRIACERDSLLAVAAVFGWGENVGMSVLRRIIGNEGVL